MPRKVHLADIPLDEAWRRLTTAQAAAGCWGSLPGLAARTGYDVTGMGQITHREANPNPAVNNTGGPSSVIPSESG